MSYDHAPDWTPRVTLPHPDEFRCPVCGEADPNIDELLNVLHMHTEHEARHVPTAIVPTCDNPDCPMCDEGYAVELECVISVVGAEQPHWGEHKYFVIDGRHSWMLVLAHDLAAVVRACAEINFPLEDYSAIRPATLTEVEAYYGNGFEPQLFD